MANPVPRTRRWRLVSILSLLNLTGVPDEASSSPMVADLYVNGAKVEWALKSLSARTVLSQATRNILGRRAGKRILSKILSTLDSGSPCTANECIQGKFVIAHSWVEADSAFLLTITSVCNCCSSGSECLGAVGVSTGITPSSRPLMDPVPRNLVLSIGILRPRGPPIEMSIISSGERLPAASSRFSR